MSRIYLSKIRFSFKVVQHMVIPVYTTILGPIILFRLDIKVIKKKKKLSSTFTGFLFIWGFISPAFTKYLQNEIILF